MKRITYNGLNFVPYIIRERIADRVHELGAMITEQFRGRNPLLICVLNGAFAFASDLFRQIDTDAEITFIKLSSYQGTCSTGVVKEIMGLNTDIKGRPVIIVEDIIDTGNTMHKLVADLRERGPEEIRIATLLFKPDALEKDIKPDYVGFRIPKKFIIGYGLDIDGMARNLPDIWVNEPDYADDSDKFNLVIFGAPGSGKGTQSEKIIETYGLHHISTGELLRDQIARGTQLGKIADSYISNGQLIPDDLMIRILESELDTPKANKGVIFDGFPRTLPQADALNKMLERRGTKLHTVVGLELDDDELTDRLIKRGKNSGRSDDNPETIQKRLQVYHNTTQPLRDYYEKEGFYHPVKGTGSVDEIFAEIKRHIDARKGEA